jgi:hypothetical protein
MRFGLFGKSDADKAETTAHAMRIKADVRDVLGLPEAAAIAVNEILCADPACPGTETVILVMNPGHKTKAFKMQSAMAELTRERVLVALADRG